MDADCIEKERGAIARIDSSIVRLISERTQAAERIGRIKKELELPVRCPEVEKAVLDRYRRLAGEYGLPEDSIVSVGELLIGMAVNRQESTEDEK